jgi:hypothetical protein
MITTVEGAGTGVSIFYRRKDIIVEIMIYSGKSVLPGGKYNNLIYRQHGALEIILIDGRGEFCIR